MSYTNPRTWVDGETVTAALLNTHLRDNLKALSDAWPTYTPTLGGWTLSNGTLTGRAVQLNKTVFGRIDYTVGNLDTKAGAPTFSLPVAPLNPTGAAVGVAGLLDTSAAARAFRFVFVSGSNLILATEADVRISPTAPWTWATGDEFHLDFRYEAA